MHGISAARRRKLRTWSYGQGPAEFKAITKQGEALPLLDLASNDYFGLSRHPALIEAAKTAMHSDGVGAGGSRLISGTRIVHTSLEEALADWLGRESVLLFPSGFQANLAGVIALASRHTPVLADNLIHHSLLLGVKASGAKLQRFKHNDLNDLQRLLSNSRQKYPKTTPLVLTESLFSMEGTSPSMSKLVDLCRKFEAHLFVDEAHALGVIGKEGRGLCYGISTPIIMLSGTFGKAFGSGGAFLASDLTIGDKLLQNSGAFRYTTALAPPLTAAAHAALKLIKANPSWGIQLQKQAQYWRDQISDAGWPRPPGYGPIISLLIGSDQAALDQQSHLEKSGLFSVAIRPPTVPEGTSRLRLVIRKDLPNKALRMLLKGLSC